MVLGLTEGDMMGVVVLLAEADVVEVDVKEDLVVDVVL